MPEKSELEKYLEKEKMKMLSIVAFGCNKRAQEELVRISGRPFIYYEYFLDQPVLKDDNEDQVKAIAIYAPFLERVLRHFQFVPDIDETKVDDYLNGGWTTVKYVATSRESMRKFLEKPIKLNSFDETTVLSWGDYIRWHNNDREPRKVTLSLKNLPDKFKEKRDPSDKVAAFKDFLVTGVPFLKHNIEELDFLTCPVGSKAIFYGTLVFACPVLLDFNEGAAKRVIAKLIRELYLPVLTLFENYWEEYILKKALKGEEWGISTWSNNRITVSKEASPATMRLIFCDNRRPSTTLEKTLNSLWEYRTTLYHPGQTKASEEKLKSLWNYGKALFKDPQTKNLKQKLESLLEYGKTLHKSVPTNEKLEDHLVFSGYNVASPRMLQLIEEVACLKLKKFDKSLPSALVVGGSGSGKDTLAKLIAIFSGEYTKGDIITINMASYKPEAISTPLLAGMDVNLMKVDGLFKNLIGREKATLILDELNSLDIDAQGALLRILENSEVVPLGSIEPVNDSSELDVLVIGVMNEDPAKLTKETALRHILTEEKLFGGALGEIFYEYVRNTRRLREDLYYRLIRGKKLVVPELAERKEDIPILFYINAKGSAGPYGVKEITIDFDAYDVLMSPGLSWPGNVRQLQAVTKEVVDQKLTEEVTAGGQPLEITAKDVRKALKEIGM